MERNLLVANPEHPLIQAYLSAREKLIAEYYQMDGENIFIPISHLSSIDSILLFCDRQYTKQKLSEEAYQLIGGYDPTVLSVKSNWVAYDNDSHSPKLVSFDTELERNDFIQQDERDYGLCELKPIPGTLEDNHDYIEEMNCDGYDCFIRIDTIIIGFIER